MVRTMELNIQGTQEAARGKIAGTDGIGNRETSAHDLRTGLKYRGLPLKNITAWPVPASHQEM